MFNSSVYKFVPNGSGITAYFPKWAWMLFGISALYLAALPLVLQAQLAVVIFLILIMLVLKHYHAYFDIKHEWGDYLRIFIIFCGVFITLRYFIWRTFNTIGFHDPASFIAAVTLYLAELYGIGIYFLGAFVNLSPLQRQPAPLPDDVAQLPSVDVLVPSYNEDAELLEITLLAATQVDYPADKLNVYLLDDGGTVQKRNDKDVKKSAEAWHRHRQLQSLCQRAGVHYLTRERNEHAKAGNINEALQHVHGELILILDADHVPATDILQATVGFFVRDDKMFLVQTPHFFINPDPIEKNLKTYEVMPSENEMFYSVIQHGLDFWNASFFCGSAAVLRRKYVDEVGGIAGDTITEDAETALTLHGLGYHSAYIGKPLISGLQPETFTGFTLQRMRWAQGMVQIFLLKNPWRNKQLTLWQKLSYTNSAFFWFFPFARTTFLLAPAAFLLFGLKIYDANLQQFFVYAMPHLVGAILVAHFLYGKVRWTFISELYETMQSLFSLVAIFKVFVNPRAPKFNVTPKGEHLEDDFISSLATPFYVLIVIGIASLVAAVLRYYYIPADRDVVYITASWEIFNLIVLTAALGALLEQRQRRKSPRVQMSTEQSAKLIIHEHVCSCQLLDISIGGTAITLTSEVPLPLTRNQRVTLVVDHPITGQSYRLAAHVCRVVADIERDSCRYQLGLQFHPDSILDQRTIVAMAFGDSELLEKNLRRRQNSIGVFKGIGFLLKTSVVYGAHHLNFIVQQSVRYIGRRIRELTRFDVANKEFAAEHAETTQQNETMVFFPTEQAETIIIKTSHAS